MTIKNKKDIQQAKMQELLCLFIGKALEKSQSLSTSRATKNNLSHTQKIIDYMLSEDKEYCTMSEGETSDWPTIKVKLKWILPIIKNCNGNINFVDETGQTILHVVLTKYANEQSSINQLFDVKEVVQKLLARGASVNHSNENGDNLLHIAAQQKNEKLLMMMLNKLTDVNVCNKNGDTLLHIIVNSHGDNQANIRVISTLLSKGADPNRKNKEGLTPVHFAAEHCLVGILQIFKKHRADFNLRTDDGKTLLHLVCNGTWGWKDNPNDVNAINFLFNEGCQINATDNEGYTPLHYARAVSCSLKVIKKLIHLGADVNFRTKETQLTPLHVASRSGNEVAIDFFIKAGIDVNVVAIGGIIPLHLAILENNYEAVNCLIKHGADVFARETVYDLTTMHMMAIGCKEKLDLLANKCIDVNVSNKNGITPLHLASMMGNVEVIQALIKRGANVHSEKFRWTPLHLASLAGKSEVVQILIDCCVDINCRDKVTQMTPLNLASMRGKIKDLKDFEGIVEYLDKWEDVLVVPFCSIVKVEIHEVINMKFDDVITLLSENGAVANVRDLLFEESVDNIWKPIAFIKRIFFYFKDNYLKKYIHWE